MTDEYLLLRRETGCKGDDEACHPHTGDEDDQEDEKEILNALKGHTGDQQIDPEYGKSGNESPDGSARDDPHDNARSFYRGDQISFMDAVLPVLDKRDPAAEHGGGEDGHHNNAHAKELEIGDIAVDLIDNDRVGCPKAQQDLGYRSLNQRGGYGIRTVDIEPDGIIVCDG